jgi:beta-glucosidase
MEDHRESLPEIRPGDMEIIHQPLDALGSNCYTGRYVRAAETDKGYELIPWSPKYPVAGTSWLHIVPESIYWAVRLVGEGAGRKDLPIFISENGCADSCDPDASGLVADVDRIMYYRAYLSQLRRAVAEGFPVSGYFPWSLLDNFEWAKGYSQRFGLVRVDYATQKRTPKLSYDWYREVIRSGGIA